MSEYRWLNEHSQYFLEQDYLLPGQTVDERVDIICNAAEKILEKEGFASQLKENIKKGWYSLSTPIWTNFGTTRGLPISCFGSYIDDSMQSILHTQAEIGMMTKHGGGTSAYFGNLRGRGQPIKDNGTSSGPVHFMQLFDKLIEVVSQGSARRGQFAAYMPLEHPDILEFLNIRSEGNPLQNISFGICASDAWLTEMVDGDKAKRKVWAKVLEARNDTGYPYIIFIDNVNKNTVDVYKDLALNISHSNLCVTGNQRVPSNYGILTVKELYSKKTKLQLFDNEKIVNASEMVLIEKNADVYKITLDNGMSHTVTKYHKILTSEYDKFNREYSVIKECQELKIGNRIAIQTKKGLFGQKDMTKEAFLLGLYQADGTQHKDSIMIDIWENDFDIIPEIQENFNIIHQQYKCNTYNVTNQFGKTFTRNRTPSQFNDCLVKFSKIKKKRLTSKTLKKALNFEKGVVPKWIWESNEKTHWEYIRGLLIADGTVFCSKSKGNPIQINLSSIDRKFLQEIQILFANLGIQTSIRILRKAGKNLLPDGKGGKRLYNTKDCWRLIIGNKNDALTIEKNTKFLSRKNIVIEDKIYRDNTKKYYKIISIEYIGKEDVYCTKVESDKHLWVCNGFITHNCTEIFLPDTHDESFVCDLSSMNILYYDEWKDTNAVEILTYFLDAIMTEFINKSRPIKFMNRAVKFAERHRALGIGWVGWHSLLQSKMIPFESMKAKLLNVEVAKNIFSSAYTASAKLAQEYGEPEVLKGYGRRNTTLMAIAPTKSSAFILGQVSEGIEPNRTNYYIKDLQKGKFSVKNPQLEQLLIEKNRNTAQSWNSILRNAGSVQHLKFLTDEEKEVFKTFAEISPKEIIIQTATRQQYIDQGQSLNLMIDSSLSAKDINSIILEAWKLGVKSLYYQIGVNAAQQFSRNILECKSCES